MKRSHTALLTAACWLLPAGPAWSEQVIRAIEWRAVAASGTLTSGTVVEGTDAPMGPRLRIVHKGTTPATFALVTIERPGISEARYALRGRVKYERVPAGSYLELWNHLPMGAFFSRTLARSGPMGQLEGSSDWRAFVVPFTNQEGGAPPTKLVFNLVMTGAGTVELGPVELVQFAAGENVIAEASGWWSDKQGGMLGAVFGSVLGLLGAAIGWLASTGRARTFVLGTLQGIAWMGVAALVLGVWAFGRGQPYGVYYPLVLVGVISAALGFSLPRSVSKRYEEVELRRMQALDA